jgi:chromosome segregation ATPase
MQALQQTLERDKEELKNEVKCLKQEKHVLEKQIELLIVEVKKEMQDSEKQMEFLVLEILSVKKEIDARPEQVDQFEFDEVAVQDITKTVYRRDRQIFYLQSQLENARLLSQTHQDESHMHSMENELHGILESVTRLQDEMKEADVAQVILQKNMKKLIRMLHDSNAARKESELMQEKLRVEAMNHLNAAIAAREEREQMGEQLRQEALQLANEANSELYKAIDVAEKAKVCVCVCVCVRVCVCVHLRVCVRERAGACLY